METVLVSLSCFGHMCNEVDIVQSSEALNEMPAAQNVHVYRDLSGEAIKFTTGEYRWRFGVGDVINDKDLQPLKSEFDQDF